jgi:ATP-dependent exoDNAse (exonuclease V) beta subunit
LRAISEQMLLHEGLPAEQLDSAVDQVESAIQGILNDQRGQWILSSAHRESHSEFAISTVVADRVVNMVIDRTFVDEQGTRWVIDYKTGSHTGGGLDEFLDREQERYRPQLEKYAMALANMEDRPIRLALYFPMMQGWREWSYS